MKVFLFVCSFCGVHTMNVYRGDQTSLFLCLHDSAGEPRDRVWCKLYVIYSIVNTNTCTTSKSQVKIY